MMAPTTTIETVTIVRPLKTFSAHSVTTAPTTEGGNATLRGLGVNDGAPEGQDLTQGEECGPRSQPGSESSGLNLRNVRCAMQRLGRHVIGRAEKLLNDFRPPAIFCHGNGGHGNQDDIGPQDAEGTEEAFGGCSAPNVQDVQDAHGRRPKMLQYRCGEPLSTGISGLEIVPEEDLSANNEDVQFPPPPPPHMLLHAHQQQQHFPAAPSSSSSSAHHLPTSSSAAASSSQSQLPPTGGVWSVFVSSASKEDNAHIIRFYLDQVFTSTREVIAFICGLIVFLLMILCLASPDWLLAEKFRQGLWVHCISEDAPLPLPFNITEKGDCFTVRNMGYIKASAALCVFCLLFDVLATAMTGCGLYSKDPVLKYRLYRYAVYTMIAALVSILIALIVYPSCFSAEIDQGNRRVWEFGWAYGVGWGAAIFLFGAVVLLLCDKESEEIYYKERTIIHDNNESKA